MNKQEREAAIRQLEHQLEALKQANWEIVGNLKGMEWANFRAELSKAGVTFDPKPVVPPAEEDPELN